MGIKDKGILGAIGASLELGGRNVPDGDRAPMGLMSRDLKLVFGAVTFFDSKRHKINVNLFNGEGMALNVSLTQPFAGTNSYISAIPDIGTVVMLGKIDGDYYPITYLPTYEASLDGKHVKKWKESIKVAGKNDFFFRHKRMAPGEVAISSSSGSEIFLDGNLRLEDGRGDDILIRNYDHSIISTSVNNYLFSGGVWSNSGIIYRNSLNSSNVVDGQFAIREVMPDGKIQYPVVASKLEGLSRKYYAEYLIEVDSQSEKIPPSNDVNSMFNRSVRVPAAVLSLGNFVGNNPTKLDTYGKLLGVQLFKSPDDTGGVFNLTSMSGESADTFGLAVALYAPSSRNYNIGTMVGIDKEGHYYQYVRSASGGGLGTGRSISILADGSKKEQFGQESSFGNSWDLTTQGGIRWVVGNHGASDNRYKEKSIDIRTTKGIFNYYGAPPEDLQSEYSLLEWDDIAKDKVSVTNTSGYKKVEVVNGRQRSEIRGTKESIISGSYLNRIEGMKEERVSQSFNVSVGGDMNVSVTNMSTETVSSQKLETFGSRTTTVTGGSNELIINNIKGVGNITETIKFIGSKETTLSTGSIKESILTVGNREFETTSGNFSANIKSIGNITMKTNIGNIELSTTAGNINIKTGGGSATLESLFTSKVKGTKVELVGRVPIKGGVVTSKTHFDYITGATLKGSMTVTATS
jgi:hypothetical protein